MTEKNQQEFHEQAERIINLKNELNNVESLVGNLKEKVSDFHILFEENKGYYLVMGVLCIAVLIFDFWVSSKTLLFLSYILKISVFFLAIIFTIVDGGLAILASGGMAGSNPVKRKRHRKTWLPVLILLGVIKLILFIWLIYTSFSELIEGEMVFRLTFDIFQIIITQAFFLLVIYAILSKAGFGLWFLVGSFWYQLREFLLKDKSKIENRLENECKDFKSIADSYNLDFMDVAKKYNIDDVVVKYIFKGNKNEQI